MQSHWSIMHSTHEAVNESLPLLTKFSASDGKDRMLETPLKKHITKIHPDMYCKMLVDEIKTMQFQTNDDEDELRQIPEIVLKDQVPELYSNLWFVVQTILSPIIYSIWQRNCSDIGSVQIANYNLKDKQQGAWHHDESADISVVIPLNTGNYEGGGTEFHNYGEVAPLPTGHALIFPSFTQMHRGLPVEMGDRYLLVFWLYNRKRMEWLLENGSP
jgi:hypothetical protein